MNRRAFLALMPAFVIRRRLTIEDIVGQKGITNLCNKIKNRLASALGPQYWVECWHVQPDRWVKVRVYRFVIGPMVASHMFGLDDWASSEEDVIQDVLQEISKQVTKGL